MIIVTGYLDVRPDDVARLRAPVAAQVAAARGFDGCLDYSFATDILAPATLRIAERWRTRAIQSAHMISDHMVDFNVAMRAARVSRGVLEAYEAGSIRKIMEIPAERFRGERDEKDIVIVLGHGRFGADEIDRLMPLMERIVTATRSEAGCMAYNYARDMVEPDTIRISEQWRDAAAIDAHFRQPYMTELRAALDAARVTELSVKAYDTSGERVLIGD